MRPLLRPPLWSRVYVSVFMLVWLGLLVSFALHAPASSLVVLGLMAAFGVTLAYRLVRVGVDGGPDGIAVRNQLRSRRIQRGDLEGFRTGTPPNVPFGARCVFALTRSDGVVTLDASTRPTFTARARQRVQDDLEVLERWLAEPGT